MDDAFIHFHRAYPSVTRPDDRGIGKLIEKNSETKEREGGKRRKEKGGGEEMSEKRKELEGRKEGREGGKM